MFNLIFWDIWVLRLVYCVWVFDIEYVMLSYFIWNYVFLKFVLFINICKSLMGVCIFYFVECVRNIYK